MEKAPLISMTQRIIQDMDNLALRLQDFLVDNGAVPEDASLTSLINAFEKLQVVAPNKNYTHFVLNEQGYIIGKNKFGDIAVIESELPPDITRGYYKIENKKVVLDENKRQQLWEVS